MVLVTYGIDISGHIWSRLLMTLIPEDIISSGYL